LNSEEELSSEFNDELDDDGGSEDEPREKLKRFLEGELNACDAIVVREVVSAGSVLIRYAQGLLLRSIRARKSGIEYSSVPSLLLSLCESAFALSPIVGDDNADLFTKE
jgi:hypothetical protein